jgi:hypothetical protein
MSHFGAARIGNGMSDAARRIAMAGNERQTTEQQRDSSIAKLQLALAKQREEFAAIEARHAERIEKLQAVIADLSHRVERLGWPKTDPVQNLAPAQASVSKIIDATCAHYGVTRRMMLGQRRLQAITLPRQVAMYIASEGTGLSLPVLGRLFGGRDHTTILHGVRKVAALVATGEVAPAVEAIRARLQA